MALSVIERMATVETVTARIETRVDQLGERSHAQAQSLTVIGGHVEHIVGAVGRIERQIETNRDAAATEHAALRAMIDPLRRDHLERLALAAAADKQAETRWSRAQIRVSLMNFGWAVVVVLTGAVAWLLGWGPKP